MSIKNQRNLKKHLKEMAQTAMKHEERVAAGLEQNNVGTPPVSWGSADAEGKIICGSTKDLPESKQSTEHISNEIEEIRQEQEDHKDIITDSNTNVDTLSNIKVSSNTDTEVNTNVHTDISPDDNTKCSIKSLDFLYGMSEEEKVCATLSMQHRAVYEYLLRLPEPWMNTRMADIRNKKGQAVPYDSKRGSLVWLTRSGFITRRSMQTIGGFKGVAFELAEDMAHCYCRMYALPLPVWLGKINVMPSVATSKSSSMATQVLTQNEQNSWLNNLYVNHPEYQFWRKCTTLEKLEQLASVTNLPQEVFDNYLRWYAFAQNKLTLRAKKNALQQFMDCLLADSLHRPEDYQPHEEKMLALAEQLAREKTERLLRIQRLEEEQARIALNNAFDSMMTRGMDDPTYKQLRSGLNEMVLAYEKNNPVLFTQAMRAAFMTLFGKKD